MTVAAAGKLRLTSKQLTPKQRAYTDALTDPFTVHSAKYPKAVLVYRYVGEHVHRDLVSDSGVVIEQQMFRASPADRAAASGTRATVDGRVEWRERRGAGPQLPWAGGERKVARQSPQRPLWRSPAADRPR